MRRDLIDAMASGDLHNEYQPVVRSSDGRIIGAEALLRWTHPTVGPLAPTAIVALAEAHGMREELARWVLEQSCLDRRKWLQHADGAPVHLSVNVSVRQVLAPLFANTVAEVLTSTGTEPSDLVLEVRESVFIRDLQDVGSALHRLKELRVLLALEDFGSGYSSLSHLRHFPIDILKLDRTFITDLDRSPASRVVAGSIVELAHRLAMTVVAVGVESAEVSEQLRALGADAQQGFHFGRPMRAAALDTLLSA